MKELSNIKILFRVDGSNEIGMGHVMRCIALANEFRNRGIPNILFLTKNYSESVQKIRTDFKCETIPFGLGKEEELIFTTIKIEDFSPAIVITDILDIGEKYLLEIKKSSILVSIDELAKTKFCSDIVINGRLNSTSLQYKDYRTTKYLVGLPYLIMDKLFSKIHDKKKKIVSEVKKILVTLGGSDDAKIFKKVLGAFGKIENDIVIKMIAGPAFKYREELDCEIKKLNKNFDLEYNISGERMADLMYEFDLAIISGGITKYELAAVGTPGITICSNEYELEITTDFAKMGSIINLGLAEEITEDRISGVIATIIKDTNLRLKMSKSGKKNIDGKGAERVAELILNEWKTRIKI